jgi:hypothetical protein
MVGNMKYDKDYEGPDFISSDRLDKYWKAIKDFTENEATSPNLKGMLRLPLQSLYDIIDGKNLKWNQQMAAGLHEKYFPDVPLPKFVREQILRYKMERVRDKMKIKWKRWQDVIALNEVLIHLERLTVPVHSDGDDKEEQKQKRSQRCLAQIFPHSEDYGYQEK